MSVYTTVVFESIALLPENGKVVKVVGVVIYDDKPEEGVQELVVEDVAGHRFNAYPHELRPVAA